MSKAEELLMDMNEAKRKRVLTQYTQQGNKSRPAPDTVPKLEAGIYKLGSDMQGLYFEITEFKGDEILRFEDSRYNEILNEINEFRIKKGVYKDLNFTHSRGVLFYGKPGTGKTVLLRMVMEDVVKDDQIILVAKHPHLLVEGLKMFKEVEPDRILVACLEDVDELCRYNEHALLELFDGDNKQEGVLYLGTTNYIDRLPPRMIREGRFDRKIMIKDPPKEGREAYFKHKLGVNEKENRIKEFVEKTDGFSFAQMREFLISIYCFGKGVDATVKRISNGLEESFTKDGDKLLESAFNSKADTLLQELNE